MKQQHFFVSATIQVREAFLTLQTKWTPFYMTASPHIALVACWPYSGLSLATCLAFLPSMAAYAKHGRRTCSTGRDSVSFNSVLVPQQRRTRKQYLQLWCSVFNLLCVWCQDVVRRYKETHSDFSQFADKVVFQLNDTHPTIAVPELMRVLMDDNKMGWTAAWAITSKVRLLQPMTVTFESHFSISTAQQCVTRK